MQWVSVGQEARGVIAIGQEATGVFALGQLATGVVAVGQVARGFVAIGQGAIGVFAVGMGSVGLVYSVAMLGVGGRGLGGVLPLIPSLGPTVRRPALTSGRRLLAGQADTGVVKVTLSRDEHGPTLIDGASALPVRLDARLRAAAAGTPDGTPLYATLTRTPAGWVCQALAEVPTGRVRSPRWWLLWSAQLGGLVVAAFLFWVLAGIPIVQALFNPGGILVGG